MESAQITATAEASGLWIFGVRSLHADETVAVGDTMPESYVWDDGEITEECIGGTCCFAIREGSDPADALRRAAEYSVSGRGRYALLGGKYTGNNDLIAEPDTIAIRDAVVLAVWS